MKRLIVCLAVFVMAAAFASVPQYISYQGVLTDDVTGEPIADGTYSITFQLYKTDEGGSYIWQENYPALQVTGGVYAVMLGSNTPFPDTVNFSEQYWLQVIVSGSPLTPRYRFGASPYAMNIADTVAKSSEQVFESNLKVDGDAHITGDLTVDGSYPVGLWTDDIGYIRPNVNSDVKIYDSGASYYIRAEWDGSSAGSAIRAVNSGTGGDAIQVTADGTGRSAIYSRGSAGVDYSIYSSANGATWAGYFNGDVEITGDLTVGGSYGLWTDPVSSPYIYPKNKSSARIYDSDEALGLYIWEGNASDTSYAVKGEHTYQGCIGELGSGRHNGVGVYGEADGADESAIYGYNTSGWAGYFDGDVEITGDLTVNGDSPISEYWALSGNDMYAVPSGFVGIGTTSPDKKLEVRGSSGADGNDLTYFYHSIGSGGGTYRALNACATGGDGTNYGVYGAAYSSDTSCAMRAYASSSGGASSVTYGIQGVAYGNGKNYAIYGQTYAGSDDYAGYFDGQVHIVEKLGVGVTSPNSKLHVNSAVDETGLRVQIDGNSKLIVDSNGGTAIGAYTTPPSNGLYVSGNTGIGNSPGNYKLYVQSSGSGTGASTAYIKNTNASGLGLIVEATSDDLPLLVTQKGSGDIFRCDSWTGGWHWVFKVDNAGKATCNVLQILGGSDLSEQFEIQDTEKHIEPGMVVSIDPENPGKLSISNKAYDRMVAGIISGAGGIKTGMMMGQTETVADGEYPIALAGRVYVMADATYGSITPGDLLTTSDTPGYAMKVLDHSRAQGAVIGKAMTSLEEGRGLVLVLVNLQ